MHIHRFRKVFAQLEAGGCGMFWRCECGEYHQDCVGGTLVPEKGAATVALEEIPEPLLSRARVIVMGRPAAMAYNKPTLLM
jgi:hypothetical protein